MRPALKEPGLTDDKNTERAVGPLIEPAANPLVLDNLNPSNIAVALFRPEPFNATAPPCDALLSNAIDCDANKKALSAMVFHVVGASAPAVLSLMRLVLSAASRFWRHGPSHRPHERPKYSSMLTRRVKSTVLRRYDVGCTFRRLRKVRASEDCAAVS